jgi:polar amino acid transport system substrate-binding protein
VKAVRLGFVVGAALLAGLGSTGAQQAALKVGYGAFTAPTAFIPNATDANFTTLDPNGTLVRGAMIEVVKAIAADAGLRIQFVPFGAGGNGGSGGGGGGYGVGGTGQKAALTGNDIDVILAAPYPADQAAADAKPTFDSSKPVYFTTEGLLAKKTDTKAYKTWDDLKGEVVGTLTGGIGDGPLQNAMLFKEVKTYDTMAEVADAVNSGAVKAAVVAGAVNLAYALQQGGGAYANLQLVKSYVPKYTFNVAIGVRKGDPTLAGIDKSLAKLKADGTLKTIFAKYAIDSYLTK